MLHNKTDSDLSRVRSSETAEIISMHAKPELLQFSATFVPVLWTNYSHLHHPPVADGSAESSSHELYKIAMALDNH